MGTVCHDASVSAIELRDIVKTFGAVRALDGLHLTVEPGEVHGFLGPNGSGKSTTIRVLLGLLKADSGSATMLGGEWVYDERSGKISAARSGSPRARRDRQRRTR